MSDENSAPPVTVRTREKPVPPANAECCENACSRCVWDIYFDELNLWKAEQKALRESAEQAAETEQSE